MDKGANPWELGLVAYTSFLPAPHGQGLMGGREEAIAPPSISGQPQHFLICTQALDFTPDSLLLTEQV